MFTFTADCETTALPEISPGFPTVKPVTPLEGCRNVAKLNDPLNESLKGSTVILPDVLRLTTPAELVNSSDRRMMFADEVRVPEAPMLLSVPRKCKTDLSFVVPVPRASITIDEVTA
jgi:hypothetical protein